MTELSSPVPRLCLTFTLTFQARVNKKVGLNLFPWKESIKYLTGCGVQTRFYNEGASLMRLLLLHQHLNIPKRNLLKQLSVAERRADAPTSYP